MLAKHAQPPHDRRMNRFARNMPCDVEEPLSQSSTVSTESPQATNVMSGPVDSRARKQTWAISGVAIAITTHLSLILTIGILRHWGLLTSIYDLGVFDQAIWGILNDRPFHDTIINISTNPINWLGFHFNPILIIFAPLYAIFPAAEWLIAIQSLALSLSAWPIFRLASKVSGSEKAGFFWTLAYLLNPFLIAAAVWDFHPVTLAVPMITCAMWALESRRSGIFLCMSLSLLLVQEQMGLTVAGLGILWGIRNKSVSYAAFITFLGVSAAYAVLGIIMPALSPTENHPMLSPGMGHLSRYSWLGHSPTDIIANIAEHPIRVAEIIFLKMRGWRYLLVLFLLYLFIPATAPALLIPSLADIAANMLSANALQRSIYSYHTVTIIPVFVIGAIYGSTKILQRAPRLSSVELASLVALATGLAAYKTAPLPLPQTENFWAPASHATSRPADATRINTLIGKDLSVSVQSNIGPHFSQRPRLYRFPEQIEAADVVVVHLKSPTTRVDSSEVGEIGDLAFHLQLRPHTYLTTLEKILSEGRHEVIYWNDSWLALRRLSTPIINPQYDQVMNRIAQLRAEWPSPL